jgi:hypothetical protein
MTFRILLPVMGLAVAGLGLAQTFPRQASVRGGGNPNEGKCTIEVVVDGAAQVEIRGASAQLVNLKGQPAQWRRFECTSPMPASPNGFRFSGVDGRGRQQLVREPRNGSPAVIEIEDPDNGSEGYTFDITWGSQGGYTQDRGPQDRGQQDRGQQDRGQQDRGPQGYPPQGPAGRPDFGRGRGNFGVDQAVGVCQDNIRQQAANRFRTNNIQFRQTTIDDNPGRGDWVIGTVEIRIPRQPDQLMRFSCSVDFNSGRVRSASMEPIYGQGQGRGAYSPDGGPRRENARALEGCERAAQQKVIAQGFDHVTLGNSRFDTDRGPRVVGDLRAYGRYGSQPFRFSCSVDPRDGDVRSVDVFRDDNNR